MSRHTEAHDLPAIAVLDGRRRPCGVVVADSPERLWAAMQDALRRQRSEQDLAPAAVIAGPLDFAAAMRRVEVEIYDAD